MDINDFQFVVFIDGMDGDVYENYESAIDAVSWAFKVGAKRVRINKWLKNKKEKNEK